MPGKGGWQRKFEDPVPLPNGRQLVGLLTEGAGSIPRRPAPATRINLCLWRNTLPVPRSVGEV